VHQEELVEQSTVSHETVAEELDLIIGDLETELSPADLEASPTSCTRFRFCI
jgi:hypothetical protein